MTRDEILTLAREAGIPAFAPSSTQLNWIELARFADLVAAQTCKPRQPLSDAALAQIWDNALNQLDPRDQLRFIARAIERAHGIGGPK